MRYSVMRSTRLTARPQLWAMSVALEAQGAAPPNRFYMYGVVARLGLLAASVELEKTDPEAIQV